MKCALVQHASLLNDSRPLTNGFFDADRRLNSRPSWTNCRTKFPITEPVSALAGRGRHGSVWLMHLPYVSLNSSCCSSTHWPTT
ncbi:hypothetical protein E2C01_025061 [Portunus trituberculatus]|uniref:Uncharacterized protein n=1 Tax=Portunus trituberculatus TaxID=210409 RepID=A0A5B7EGU4_PORTR|nr:hypothetical protein [Portunus trituberculatus]